MGFYYTRLHNYVSFTIAVKTATSFIIKSSRVRMSLLRLPINLMNCNRSPLLNLRIIKPSKLFYCDVLKFVSIFTLKVYFSVRFLSAEKRTRTRKKQNYNLYNNWLYGALLWHRQKRIKRLLTPLVSVS
jgi:hypothetical protein